VNIVVLSVEREEGEGGSLVLTFTILAKIISNIGWFIMWVQAIEVCKYARRKIKWLCLKLIQKYRISDLHQFPDPEP